MNDTPVNTSSGSADTAVSVGWRADKAVRLSPDGLEVWHFGGAGPVRLGGNGSAYLADAVNGERTLDGVIAHATAAGMDANDADRIARRWLASGHLVAVKPDPGPPLVRLVDRSSAHNAEPLAARVAQALALAGLRVQGMASEGDGAGSTPLLTLVLVDDLLATSAALEGIQGPAVAVQLYGERPMLSPLIHADASCALCLESRLRLRRSVELVAAARVGLSLPPRSPVLHAAGLPLAAAVLAAMAHACQSLPVGAAVHARQVSVLYPAVGRIEHHTLVPVAGCPACDAHGVSVLATHLTHPGLGASVPAAQGAPGAQDQILQTERSGGFRVVDPAATWERYAHLVSDVVGLVPSISASGAAEFRAFSAGPNVAVSGHLELLRSRLRANSGGKGITLTGARTGALAEALERDALRAQGNEPFCRARMAELEGAIHPNEIQLFSPRQLQQAEQLWALGLQPDTDLRGMQRVPRPFDTEAVHDWCAVAELGSGRRRWLPASMLWFNWPNCPPGYPGGSSNGAAAGNTVEEALLQGLLERVERDAVALWWYPRCRRPAIDLSAWDDARIDAALAPQLALGHKVWVLDLTTDLGIPAAVAVAVGMKPVPTAPMLGFGAHLDPVIAVVRALTELAQMQAPLSRFDPNVPLEFPGAAEKRWFAEVTPEREPWLLPHGSVTPGRCDPRMGVAEALQTVVARIAARGMTVLWADCTRADVGLPVVRTWAPGLRHFWNRFAPGRLYQVPPALGWCAPGYGEDDLNPLAMIL